MMKSPNSTSERIYSLDVIRVLACLMVVILHCPKPGEMAAQNGVFLSALSYITSPCVPLFFMISGALLLNTTCDAERFIRKRVGKFIVPIFVWSNLYLANRVITGRIDSWYELIRSILSIPFSCQEYLLWFMYTLIGLYLITPILTSWLNNATQREIRIYLLVWGITLIYPYLESYFKIDKWNTGMLYYLSGYVGYYLLGWYIFRYCRIKNRDRQLNDGRAIIVLGAMTLISIAAKALDKSFGFGIDEHGGFWFLSLAVAIMSVFWWLVCDRLAQTHFLQADKVKDVIGFIADYSFGIYLCHMLLMRPWIWNLPFISDISNYPLQTAVIVTVDFLCSLLLCWLISLTPVSRYIIGFSRRKR